MKMAQDIHTCAGYVVISQQLCDEVAKSLCADKANMRYAWTGKRSACVCGQHEDPVPLAPLLLDGE